MLPGRPNIVQLSKVSKLFVVGDAERRTVLSHVLSFASPVRTIAALQNISLTIKRGDSIALIGPNGSGKTTLLRILSGILQPSSGKIKIMVRPTPVLQVGVGFQPELSALQNIFIYGLFCGHTISQMKEKLKFIFDFSELGNYQNVKLKYFSSGMLVRLAFATMLSMDPEFLVMDELLSLGDLHFQKKTYRFLKSFVRKGGTLVLATQMVLSLSRFKDLYKSAVYLSEGRIICKGDLDYVVGRYVRDTLSSKDLSHPFL